jgi:hypothetical protein
MSEVQEHIQPCQEEIDHPFVMVPRDLIRNPNISPECKWFISYLLSHSGKWKVSIPYVIKTQKISKNRIYPIINEAIEAGYVKREEYLTEGKKRYRYIVSREPKFKKFLLCPQNQDTENQDTENEDTKEYKSSFQEEREEKPEVGSASPNVSADAVSLCDFFHQKILERNKNFKAPNLIKWRNCIELLLRIDKRDLEQTRALILWASKHNWWKTACLSPEKLRKCWDEMFMQMNAQSEKALVQQNRTYAINLKEKFPEKMKAMTFDDKFVLNRFAGKEIPFNLPHENFKSLVVSLFGGRYVAER